MDTVEPWQIEKDIMPGIYVQFSYGCHETGIVKIAVSKINLLKVQI